MEKYFQSSLLERKFKNDKTIVTQADEEIEKRIIEVLKKDYPDHAILGEESGQKNTVVTKDESKSILAVKVNSFSHFLRGCLHTSDA